MANSERPRILIAEDHAAIAGFLKTLLTPEFDVVGCVSDGQSLLRSMQDLMPDVVLMDINLPIFNGLQALPKVKEINPGAKIIFVTGNIDSAVIEEAIHRGAVGYVAKATVASDLITATRSALRGEVYISKCLLE